MKHETLEEAAEKQWGNVHRTGVLGFIEGAKWQAERMYSEEDMIKFGEIIAWNMVGKTITESFIKTLSKECFKKYNKEDTQ